MPKATDAFMLKNLIDKFRREASKPQAETALMDTFERIPVCFVRGEGSCLLDEDENQYLDAMGGRAETIIGHCHPQISETISLQAIKLLQTNNQFHCKEQSQLARKFCQLAQMEKVLFTNSGIEANTTAVKIARLHGLNRGIDKPVIIIANPSHHIHAGAMQQRAPGNNTEIGREPLAGDFIHVSFNDLNAIGKHAENNRIVAIMIESIQGEAGVIIPDQGYLQAVRALCDEHGWLLILDEIQSGIARTGKWFAYQHEAILPDVMTSARALGNGIPIGACAARGPAAAVLRPNLNCNTAGSNPLACRVALKTIDIIEQQNLLQAASETGVFLKRQIQQHIGTHDKVTDIRGKGMMLALELDRPYPDLARRFLAAGLVADVLADGKMVRLLPAINLNQADARQIALIIHDVVVSLD